MIDFAQQLEKDFQTYVSNNADVHFSAGIMLCNPHFPIGKISEGTKDLQDDSKDSNKRKNRVSIFNHVMTWNSFNSKIDLGRTFEEALETPRSKESAVSGAKVSNKGKLNSAFAYKIMQLVKSSFYERSGIDEDNIKFKRGGVNMRRFARNVENMRYLFARHGYDKKKSEELVGKLEQALVGDFLQSLTLATMNSNT